MSNIFIKKTEEFFADIGTAKNMVLSTSLNDRVTSRMMSVIIYNNKFYFQTDNAFRKYRQIIHNPYVSLCFDNVQIEGRCVELGKPMDNFKFCELYKEYFISSYNKYTKLENERLFIVEPNYIQKWIYIDKKPLIEKFDFITEKYITETYFNSNLFG
jgi:uncharacterized pyridoxamine 5'-phosphate oxidase family protein